MIKLHAPAEWRPDESERGESGFLSAGGEMGAAMRSHDWSASPLGSPETWPQSLRTAVSILLNSKYPMFLAWGPQLAFLYNDGYAPIFGAKHPGPLGRPFAEVWSEIWHDIRPLVDRALAGEATFHENLQLTMERSGYPEEVYFTFSYSPIRDETGGVGGMFCACTETTQQVLEERRLQTLNELSAAAAAAQARTIEETHALCLQALRRDPSDIPFACLYEFVDSGRFAHLVGTANIQSGHPASPSHIALGSGPWPLELVAQGETEFVTDLRSKLVDAPESCHGEPVQAAMILPVPRRDQGTVAAALVLGLNPRRALDEAYRRFLERVAAAVATASANAKAFQAERNRAETLAEIDRAKTAFFNNVSHEFRTPLTLMLGPLEDALAEHSAEPGAQRDRLLMAHRNALRLMKLVNTLLDFARIEAGRVQASYAPTDLAALTADLSSAFRSAIERAGLKLMVDCPPLPQPIYVDRDMWEKIVLNLLSNALKFTFEGLIAVSLRWRDGRAELAVTDTGTGIPPDRIPNLFERFHRVPNARARTHEGSGIGLALVHDLAHLHRGAVRVESTVGQGSTFTVSVPAGTAHLPPDQIAAEPPGPRQAAAQPYVQEVLRWFPGQGEDEGARLDDSARQHTEPVARIIVADDNADMRDYIRRLLPPHWQAEAVADGDAALTSARRDRPDLILADVMMPGLDGFQLVHALRADDSLRDVRIMLLSARAGEEARVEGLGSGADDYMIKPFAARELIARIANQIHSAQAQREGEARLRASETYFRAISDDAPVMIWLTDPSGLCTYLNRRWLDFTGQTFEEGLGLGWLKSVHPDDRPAARLGFLGANERREPFSVDYRLRRNDGVWRWAIDMGMPRLSEDGAFLGYVGSVIDITERKEAEERTKLLAGEVDHRAKNMLAVVQAVVRMTCAESVPDFKELVVGRISALARAHNLLADTRWSGADLARMVSDELAAYIGRDAVRVSISGPPVSLDVSDAQALAMAFHELATNAAKFGALSSPRGQVAVEWTLGPDGEVAIVWRERGGAAVQAPTASGFGTSLIRRTIGEQLGGEVEFDWSSEGLTCRMRLPARDMTKSAATP